MYALRERRQHVTQEDFELSVAKVSVLFVSPAALRHAHALPVLSYRCCARPVMPTLPPTSSSTRRRRLARCNKIPPLQLHATFCFVDLRELASAFLSLASAISLLFVSSSRSRLSWHEKKDTPTSATRLQHGTTFPHPFARCPLPAPFVALFLARQPLAAFSLNYTSAVLASRTLCG